MTTKFQSDTSPTQSAQADLLSRANFTPVFDENGDFQDITHVKVDTDVRLGVRAMRELLETSQPHDELVLPTGFTAKQARILATPAPMTAHYLKSSRRWDAALGEFVPKVTIKLPYEVVWALFETLFAGQFSVRIEELSCVTEDVVPAPQAEGVRTDDAPGRLYFAQARVTLTLHLANGQTRSTEGLGISYDNVRIEKSGNVWALNSSRRMAEKGAISDAKREAMANLGPVFRLAFEDGDEMIEKIEQKLAQKLAEQNQRPSAAAGGSTSAAPRRPVRATASDKAASTAATPAPTSVDPESAIPEDYLPYEATLEMSAPTPAPDEAATVASTAETGAEPVEGSKAEREAPVAQEAPTPEVDDEARDIGSIQDAVLSAPTEATARATLAAHRDALARLDPSGRSHAEMEAMIAEAYGEEDGLPDFADSPATAIDPAWTIDAQDKSSTAVLRLFLALFKKAKSTADLDAIISANPTAARRLNPTHMVEMATAKEARRASLG